MENRIKLDQEIDIPISLIDEAPFNPKSPIDGVYRKGLNGSLNRWGVRDRLKVFPNPSIKGRYLCLNGNKRMDVITKHVVNERIKVHFGLDGKCSPADIDKILNHPDNAERVKKIKESIHDYNVPCQVMTQLDEHQALSLTDAKEFVATYDRNQAKFDEVKQAEVYREVLAERLKTSSDETRKNIESSLKLMLRPELPTVPPQPDAQTVQPAFKFDQPGAYTATDSNPWGANPPAPNQEDKPQVPQFVPMVFAFSPDGYKQISESILRSSSRMFREEKLKTALVNLEKILSNDLDDIINSVVVETALLILNKKIETNVAK